VLKKTLAVFVLTAFFAALAPASGSCAGPLPKGKTIAVLVRSGSAQYARSAEAIIISSLLQGGYNAVDQRQLESIRKNKAAALALDGDVDAILKLSQTYGFNVLVSGRATVHDPVKNEFGLFTATASVSVTACQGSSGKQLFADSASAKEVGYTGAEAGQKALESAARAAASAMIEGRSSAGGTAAALKDLEVEVSGVRSFVEAHAIVEVLDKAGCGSSSLISFSGGTALVKASWSGAPDSLAQKIIQQRSDLALEKIENGRIYMVRR